MRAFSTWRPIICDFDAGSIKPGPGYNREYWRKLLEGRPYIDDLLFIDRRHGHLSSQLVESYCHQAILDEKKPLLLGGDHSLTYFAYRAVEQAVGFRPDLLHYDAHHDSWPSIDVTNYSFAWHLRNRGTSIRTLGIREEWPNQKDLNIQAIDSPYYLSIDVDVFSPEVFPEVSFPVPSLTNNSLLDIPWLQKSVSNEACKHRILAADIMEWVPPINEPSSCSEAIDELLDIVLQIT